MTALLEIGGAFVFGFGLWTIRPVFGILFAGAILMFFGFALGVPRK